MNKSLIYPLLLAFLIVSCGMNTSEINSVPISSSDTLSPGEGIDPYEIYLLAVESGFQGTFQDWLASIRGRNGTPIELSASEGYLQWRYVGDSTWTNLMSFVSMTGPTGATGLNGEDGATPYIGTNGNWWFRESDLGIDASPKGEIGDSGEIPHVGENGNWWIGFDDLGIRAAGQNGKSAYERYRLANPSYEGSEAQWILDFTTGKFFKKFHLITFDSLGGSTVEPQLVLNGNRINEPIPPTKLGHTFRGWYVDLERWVFVGFAVTEPITLTAMWDPIIYSISYVLNGGTNHPSNPLNYVFGESVIFQNPTRDGYEFEGWFSDSSLTQSKNKIESVELGNVTIYAKWAIKLFNINYVLNGGNNSIYNINQYRSSDSRIYLLDPVRSGYAFVSWYLDSAFTTSIFNFEPSMVLSDLTVYAKWQLIPTTDPFVPGGILSNTEEANNYFFTVTDSSTSLKQISTIKFIPSVSGVYNLYSTNTTSLDTYGLLYDEFGTLLETDDDDGAGSNFSMTRYLYAGRKYYLRSHLFFTSSTGSWSVFIRFQRSEIFTNLTNVTLNTIYTTSDTSTTSFVYFGLRFVPINSGLYYVETLGMLDVEAYTITVDGFYTSFDDDSGEGLNSKIQVYLIAGNVYFIVTNLYTASLTGSYQVVVYPA